MPHITNEDKSRFLSKVYFGVSDNPEDDVNPYTDLREFLNATVGDLKWGNNAEVRMRSKVRFSNNFSRALWSFYIILEVDVIFDSIQNDDKLNEKLVEEWAEKAQFERA